MKMELFYNSGMLINEEYVNLLSTLGEFLLLKYRANDQDAIVMSNIKGQKVVLKLGDLRKCFVIADIGICFVLSNDKVSNCGRLCQALTLFPYGWLKKTRSDILKGQALFIRLNYSFSFLNYRPQRVDWVIYYTGNEIKKSNTFYQQFSIYLGYIMTIGDSQNRSQS